MWLPHGPGNALGSRLGVAGRKLARCRTVEWNPMPSPYFNNHERVLVPNPDDPNNGLLPAQIVGDFSDAPGTNVCIQFEDANLTGAPGMPIWVLAERLVRLP
jgi:hypothetical protein